MLSISWIVTTKFIIVYLDSTATMHGCNYSIVYRTYIIMAGCYLYMMSLSSQKVPVLDDWNNTESDSEIKDQHNMSKASEVPDKDEPQSKTDVLQ